MMMMMMMMMISREDQSLSWLVGGGEEDSTCQGHWYAGEEEIPTIRSHNSLLCREYPPIQIFSLQRGGRR